MGNGKASTSTYNFGVPLRFLTSGVQDLQMVFNNTNGNLNQRKDNMYNLTEDFTCDNLNRLKTIKLNNALTNSINYDGSSNQSMGNIVSKTDAGNYTYRTDKKHAIAYIQNPAGSTAPPLNTPTTEQVIAYNSFKKLTQITEGSWQANFVYGSDRERVKMEWKENGVLKEKRIYLGNCEIQVKNGVTRYIHYLSGGNGLSAIVVNEGSTVAPYFVYTDHLGTPVAFTNSSGTVVARQSFDGWGRQRNPANWQDDGQSGVPPILAEAWLYRGLPGIRDCPNFNPFK